MKGIIVALFLAVAAPVHAESAVVQVDSWFSAREGYGSIVYLNVWVLKGATVFATRSDGRWSVDRVDPRAERWTLKGDAGLDPGKYDVDIDGDVVRFRRVVDVKGKEHSLKFHVYAHSWVRPTR